MLVERCTRGTLEAWAALRHALWPDAAASALLAEAGAMLEEGDRLAAFLVRSPGSAIIGFAEASLRQDYVNGCVTSPVAFLEGLYVHPEWRRRGAARLVVRSVEEWAKSLGCRELASDADIRNHGSQRMHLALGFEDTERVVYFRRALTDE